MTEERPINVFMIPSHVPMRGGAKLAGWLTHLDRTADSAKGRSRDGYFTEDNFEFFRAQSADQLVRNYPYAKDLKRFRSFAQFAHYIDTHIRSKFCDDPRVKAWRPHGGIGAEDPASTRCLASPEPALPPLIAQPRRTARKPPDLSKFTLTPPTWFGDPRAVHGVRLPAHTSLMRLSSLPSYESLVTSRAQSAFRNLAKDILERAGSAGGSMRASYDGRFFVMHIRGCIVESALDHRCNDRWQYFLFSLKNLSTGRRISKQADARGTLTIRIEATRGEQVRAYGIDSFGGGRSLNTMYFYINPQGKLEVSEVVHGR